MVISQDPEVLYALGALSDRLRVKGKDDLAEKLENLFDLHEAELKAKSRKQSQYWLMPVVITEEVTLADIDETIAYVNELLKTDTYGNRMNWQKKEDLIMSIDELLDARINLAKTGKAFPNGEA